MKATNETRLFGDQLAVKVERVAEALDCSRSQVYALLESGHLRKIKLSSGKRGGVRVLCKSVEEFLEGSGVEPEIELTAHERVAHGKQMLRRSSKNWVA